jgi:hypothetical protein
MMGDRWPWQVQHNWHFSSAPVFTRTGDAPRDDMEKQIARIWQDAFAIDEVNQ